MLIDISSINKAFIIIIIIIIHNMSPSRGPEGAKDEYEKDLQYNG